MPIALQNVSRALQLDSNLAEALATAGLINCSFYYNWANAKILFEKAIKVDPNYGYAHVFYGNLLLWVYGNKEQGLKETRKALSLNPLSTPLNWIMGRNYFFAKEYDSAYLYTKKTFLMNPDFKESLSTYSLLLAQRKEFTEAFRVTEGLPEKSINILQDLKGPVLNWLYAVSGNRARAKMELKKALALSTNQSPYQVAIAYIAIGDMDKAMEYLERAYEIRDIRLWLLKIDSRLDPIRNNPAFNALLDKVHLGNS
jgi:adenylate cyclase